MKKNGKNLLRPLKAPFAAKALYFLLVLAALFLLWWLLAATAFKDNPMVPAPPEVFRSLFSALAEARLWRAVWNTVFKSFLGFAVSFLLGGTLAVLANISRRVKYCVDPVVTLIRALPTLAVTFILLMWFSADAAAVVIGVFIIFPVFYTGLYAAVAGIDKKTLQMAEVYRIPLFNRITQIYIPGIAPALSASALSAFALNLKVVIAAEIVGIPRNSVGLSLISAYNARDFALVFAWVFIAVILAFLFEAVIKFITRLCIPHKYTTRKTIARLFRRAGKETEAGGLNGIENKETDVHSPPVPGFPSAPPPIKLTAVNFSYPAAAVFKSFSADFAPNEIHCIMGPSGAGKTTLLNLAAGLIAPESGAISPGSGELEAGNNGVPKGANVKNKAGRFPLSYMFQEPRLIAEKTVLQNLMLALSAEPREKGVKRSEVKRGAELRARKYLAAVGLAGKENLYPRELSGGMAQRVSLSRAFLVQSEILLMDEPFKGLNYGLKKRSRELFLSLLRESGKTVLFVTHDADEAYLTADRIYLFEGKAPHGGLTEVKIEKAREKRKLSDACLVKLKEELLV